MDLGGEEAVRDCEVREDIPCYCLGLVLMAPIVAEGLLKAFTVTRAFREAGVAILNWTLLQSWIPYTATTWNGPGWSLSDEAFFYLCFPIFGVLLRRCSRLRTVSTVGLFLWTAALLAAAIAVMKAVPGLGNVPATISSATSPILWKNFVRFNPLVRIPEFCAGILLARIYGLLRHRKSWLVGRGYYLYVPGLILEFCVILQAKHLPYVLVHNGLLLPLHGCVILGFALGGGIMVRALSLPVLVFGGNASYAMYILHSPIRDWLDFTVKELHFQPLNGLGAMAMYVGLVIAISSAAFQWIEQPANHYLRAKLQSWANQNADPKAPQLVMADFLPNANF